MSSKFEEALSQVTAKVTHPPKGWAGGMEWDGKEGTVTSNPLTDETDDIEQLLEKHGIDPAEVEVVDHVIKRWDAQTPEGVQTLTSHRFKVRARTRQLEVADVTDVEDAIERVKSLQLPRRTPGAGLGGPVAESVNMADWQLGKSEGGGVKATTERVLDALDQEVERIERLRARGSNIEELVLSNMGDPIEGCNGHYAAQLFTVEGGYRAQMRLTLELWQLYATTLFPMFDKVKFVSVLCNHGEFGRMAGGSKAITSDSDNAGGFLAEALKMIIDSSGKFDNVEWIIPHDEMNVYTEVAGVPMGFNHGHKIPGNGEQGFEKWLNGQVRGDREAWEAELWVTAHRHHLTSFDLGSTFVFGCPSMDGGSKWLRDSTGRFARAGTLSFIVDKNEPLKWRDYQVL